jgi:hypothetical protein
MLSTFLPPPTNQCAICARYTNTNHLQASTYLPSTYRSLTHLFLPTAHEAILISIRLSTRHNLIQPTGGQKLMWRVNFSLAMMSTFQQIALVPPSYLAPIRTSSPFQMQADYTLRPGIENNTNTGHVSVTKNNLPHIGVIYRRWTWSRGIGKMKMICAIGVFPGS